MTEEEIVRVLAGQNEEFRRLGEEHRSLDEKLSEIEGRVYLAPEEQLERQRLKKLKLSKKDRMAELVRKYREGHTN